MNRCKTNIIDPSKDSNLWPWKKNNLVVVLKYDGIFSYSMLLLDKFIYEIVDFTELIK